MELHFVLRSYYFVYTQRRTSSTSSRCSFDCGHEMQGFLSYNMNTCTTLSRAASSASSFCTKHLLRAEARVLRPKAILCFKVQICTEYIFCSLLRKLLNSVNPPQSKVLSFILQVRASVSTSLPRAFALNDHLHNYADTTIPLYIATHSWRNATLTLHRNSA